MEKENGNWVGFSQLAEHGKVQGRVISLPPKRGQIKEEIFASIARSVMEALNALKRRGTILGKKNHEIMAPFIAYCCEKEGNSVPSSVGMDLLRALNEGQWDSN